MKSHLHILGIGGTFMAGIAVIAKEMGFRVSGSDKNLYPPMSTQLAQLGIEFIEGYDERTLGVQADVWLVGNGISRGNPLLEALLDSKEHYISAPQWLYENVLRHRHVIAIAGTHGKTTTTAMTTFMLDQIAQSQSMDNIQGECGFLIGGVASDFPFSARLGNNPFFVIEADEYDTALFDKRSKFVHYHPHTAILNNLEFDHADIFPDLTAIETQFHHLVRTLPRSARVIANAASEALYRVRDRGCYCDWQWFNAMEGWHVVAENVTHPQQPTYAIPANIVGSHNRNNALAAALALEHLGIPLPQSLVTLQHFKGVRRRLECRGVLPVQGGKVTLYDDFAHHPTAIRETINALKEKINAEGANVNPALKPRIIAVIEPRSNTMKMGVFAHNLADSLRDADCVIGYNKGLGWDLAAALTAIEARVFDDMPTLVAHVAALARAGDTIIGMSNGSFDGFHQQLIDTLNHAGD